MSLTENTDKITADRKNRLAALKLATGIFCLGLIALLRHRPSAAVFFWVAAGVWCAGLLSPVLVGLVLEGLKFLVRLAGTLLFCLFYFLILTPYGLAYRLIKPTDRGSSDSFWIQQSGPGDKESYERQY